MSEAQHPGATGGAEADGKAHVACEARAALQQLAPGAAANGWISVEERLPRESETVIIGRSGGLSFPAFRKGDWWHGDESRDMICDYPWWMPLPEPPGGAAARADAGEASK